MITYKTLRGPNGLKLELDANEIFPNDPGQGTPAIVSLITAEGEFTATYNCASSEGELDGYPLNADQLNWLRAKESFVERFIDRN